MTKYAADNLMLLRERFPDIYQLVRSPMLQRDRYGVDAAKDGTPNLRFETGGAERRMYSQYSPSNEASAWASSVRDEIGSAEHVFVYGLGLGYHLEQLIANDKDKKLYLYEPDPDVLRLAVEHRDLRRILSHKQIVLFGVGSDHAVQLEFQRNVLKRITNSFATVVTPPYKRFFDEDVKRFMSGFEKTAADFRSVLATVSHFQIGWTRNLILNLERNLNTPSIQGLKDACQGMPAVVVGSGPSLEEAIEPLKALKGRALIIAAGTSILALRSHGIEPDLVVSMDPGEPNRRAFAKVNLEDTPFLYIPTIHHAILEQKFNYLMHAYYHVDFMTAYLMQLDEEAPVFQSSSSVSGTALQVAAYLGCRELILVGHDLSYPNDRYYSSGVNHVNAAWEKRKMDRADEWVRNVAGGLNKTDRTMTGLKYGMEEIIRQLRGVAVFNASQIGAAIENTRPVQLMAFMTERLSEQSAVDENWFKRLIGKKAVLQTYDKRLKTKRHIEQSHKSVDALHKRFEQLEAHLLRFKPEWNERRKTEWLNRFDEHWLPIVESEVFKHIHTFILQREINYLERYWEQIVRETSISKKTALLLNCVEPMISGYKKIARELLLHFDELDNRLRAVQVS